MNYLLSEKSLLSKFKGNLGEDDYKEPLSMLLDSLNNEANLSLIGKTAFLIGRRAGASHIQAGNTHRRRWAGVPDVGAVAESCCFAPAPS